MSILIIFLSKDDKIYSFLIILDFIDLFFMILYVSKIKIEKEIKKLLNSTFKNKKNKIK